jgi:hypothetical protein
VIKRDGTGVLEKPKMEFEAGESAKYIGIPYKR